MHARSVNNIIDTNNRELHFIGPWQLRCLDLLGNGWRDLNRNGPNYKDWVNEHWHANKAWNVQGVRNAVDSWRQELGAESLKPPKYAANNRSDEPQSACK